MDGCQAHPPDGAGRADAPGRELIALDLDGTLVDARVRQVGVAAEVLASMTGAVLDEDAFWALKRDGANTADALTALGWPQATASEVARGWGALVESDGWLARDRALPGVAEALSSLDGPALVVTARRRETGAAVSLRAAGLHGLVGEVAVVDPREAARAKASVLSARDAAGFVGDSASDGEAARLAQVPFVAVDTGQRTAAFLRAAGFDVAGSLAEALSRLR